MTVTRNRLDQLRLLFASLVLVSHSSELLYGNRNYEPIARLFGTTSFGELSVCGFFIISGYLISRAWEHDPRPLVYAKNRILRIYPAFIVATLISVLIVGAIGAQDVVAYWRAIDWQQLALRVIDAKEPASPTTFGGLPAPFVNGSMWTLHYEVLCYAIAPLICRRSVLLWFWPLCAVILVSRHADWFRLVAMFASGAVLREIDPKPDRRLMAIAALTLFVSLFFRGFWELSVATAGAYLVICVGQGTTRLRLPEISYGTYLYGWPAQMLLIYYGVSSAALVFVSSLAVALCMGVASWYLIERHALKLKSHPLRPAHHGGVLRTGAAGRPDKDVAIAS